MSEKERRKILKKKYLNQDPVYSKLKSRLPQKLTLEDLMKSADDELEWVVVEVVLNRIESSRGRERETLLCLPESAGFLFATWLLEAEVMNGGFAQFFFNQASHLWSMAVQGYHQFGLMNSANAMAAAIRKQQTGNDDFSNEEQIFDQAYFEIKRVKEKYIRENQERFVI